MPDYTLVIVEDEEDIRNGLANIIDWGSLRFKVAGTFDNGQRAIDFLTACDVDVIITDIVMPDVNGLDFAAWLRQKKPDSRIIVLSGYSEFNYAQQAIKLGVKYYLLKPTNMDELVAAFTEIARELDAERQKKDRDRELQKKQDKLSSFYQANILNKIFLEEITDEALIGPALEVGGLKADAAGHGWWFCVMLASGPRKVEQTGPAGGFFKDMEAVFNALNSNNTFFSAIPLSCLNNRIYSVLWPRTDELLDMQYVDGLSAAIRKKISGLKSLLGIEIYIESLSYYESLTDMLKDTANVRKKLLESAAAGRGDILMAENSQYNEMEAIKDAVRRNDLAALKESIDGIESNLSAYSLSMVENLGMVLVQELRIHLVRKRMEIPDILSDETVYRSIVSAEGCGALIVYYRQVVSEYEKHLNVIEKLGVRRSMKYITEHVCEDISIADIASQVYLNPSYLCRMFKKETGENLSEYIMKKKMEKAREYLKNPEYKVYQVGEMIGYHDVRHFYKVFKKTTGLTPQEYRNRSFA